MNICFFTFGIILHSKSYEEHRPNHQELITMGMRRGARRKYTSSPWFKSWQLLNFMARQLVAHRASDRDFHIPQTFHKARADKTQTNLRSPAPLTAIPHPSPGNCHRVREMRKTTWVPGGFVGFKGRRLMLRSTTSNNLDSVFTYMKCAFLSKGRFCA